MIMPILAGLKKKDGSSGERDRALAYVFVKSIPKTLMEKNDFSALQKTCIEDLPYYSVDYDVLKGADPKKTNKE